VISGNPIYALIVVVDRYYCDISSVLGGADVKKVPLVSLLVAMTLLSFAHGAERNTATRSNPEQGEPQYNPGPTVGVATISTDGTIRVQFRVVGQGGAIGDALREYKPGDPRYEDVKKFLGDIKPGEAKSITLPRE
jgi:hypothetical protein